MSVTKIKIGQLITIDVDKLCKDLLNKYVDGKVLPEVMRTAFSLKYSKKYKTIDICRHCKIAFIIIQKKQFAIKYKYITSVE
jgi:hypothetical protein